MMNLFEGVRKMTDDEIRMQIALFRNVPAECRERNVG